MSQQKIIHELLDIDAGDEEEVETSQELTVVEEGQPLTLQIGGAVEVDQDEEDIRLDGDFDEAINNIKDAITIAKDASDKVSNIATHSEDDKDFNALAGLLKLQVEASERIIGLYKTKMDYKEKKRKLVAPINAAGPSTGGTTVNIDKAVFTGTLDQLSSAIDGKDE